MNIGIYSPRVGIYDTGGTETFLRKMMQELSRTDEITLYTGAGPLVDQVIDLDIIVEQIELYTEADPLTAQLARWTPLHPVEVESFSMFVNAYRSGVLTEMGDREDVVSLHSLLDDVLVSRFTDVPTLFRVPAIDLPSRRWEVFSCIDQADRWVTNSHWTAGKVEQGLGRDVDGVVYAGVDLDRFSPDASPALSFGNPVVLYVGRFDPGKGLRELVKAHKLVLQRDDVELLLVGDGSLRDELEDTVAKLGTADQVTFTGAVPHQEVHRYYAAADVFCLPSHSEGFGLGNIEAMACGIPVVTTRVGAIPEYIDHEENGLLVPRGDVNALCDAIGSLIRDPEFRETLAASALEDVREFSWSNQAQQMRKHYREVAIETGGR